MATPEGEVIRGELTCIICYEYYRQPKTLTSCLHTFCEECLKNYVSTKLSDGVEATLIPCPCCRDPTDLSNGVSAIKTNFKFTKMIESLFKYCQKCSADEQEKAESYCNECKIYLCELCSKYHKKSRDYPNHSLVKIPINSPIITTPTNLPQVTTPTNTPPSTPTIPKCPQHTTENLIVYCITCKEVLCTMCVVLTHRECSCNYIDENLIAEEKTKLGEQYEKLRQILQDMTAHHQRLMNVKKSIDEKQTQLLAQIRQATDEMKEQIENNFTQLKAEVSNSFNQDLISHQLMINNKISQRIGTTLLVDLDKIPGLQLLKRSKQIYDEIESLKEESSQTLQADIPEHSKQDLKFLPSPTPSVGHLLEEICTYGGNLPSAIEQGKEHRFVLQSKNSRSEDIKYGGANINPRISHSHSPDTFLPCEVLDSDSNGTYELRYTPTHHTPLTIRLEPNYIIQDLPVVRSYSPFVPMPFEYPIPSPPYGVCALPNNRLAVSLYDKKVIIMDVSENEEERRVLHELSSNFVRPYNMCVDRESLWVTDREGHNIQRFSLDNYTKLLHYGTRGTQPGQFLHPRGITIHPNTGRVYVTDMKNHRIQVFRQTTTNELELASCFGGKGKGEIQFDQPAGLIFNHQDQLVICDDQNCRLQVLTADGHYVTSYGLTKGQRGILCSPIGVAQDSHGRYIVGEFGSHLVTVLSPQGQLLSCIRTLGETYGPLSHPRGVAVDMNDFIYVADFGNKRVIRM